MSKRTQTVKKWLVLAAFLAACPSLLSCVEHEKRHIEGVNAFVVKTWPLMGGDYGTADKPLTFPTAFYTGVGCPARETCFSVELGAYAVDVEGKFLKDYNETVPINAEPGSLNVETVQFRDGLVGDWLLDDNGNPALLLHGIEVGIRYSHGTTRIWLEDVDRKPRASFEDEVCPNGRMTEDKVYCEPTLSTGVSEEYVFEPQTVRMIQYNPEQLDGQSPINKDYGQIRARKGHDIVVTNVVSTGFYITDLGDEDYNSMFIFTYSQPGRVEIGDRVCEVSGGIAEFTGMTQLQFPSWGIQNKERSTAEDIDPAPEDGDSGVGSCIDKETGKERPCTEEELAAMSAIVDCSDVYFDRKLTKQEKKEFAFINPPEPRVLSPELLSLRSAEKGLTGIDGQSVRTDPVQTNALERLESAVVTIEKIRLSTEFIDCDDNGNSKIESGTDEADCRTECQNNSTMCTELSSLRSYDQWQAWTIDGDAKLAVASSSLIANFDITEDCVSWIDPTSERQMMRCPERHLMRLTGNLKQILPGCSGASGNKFCYASRWTPQMVMTVIEPRIKTDLVMDDAFNKMAKAEFDECINDDRTGGCLDTCKESAQACTCENFAAYRIRHPAKDASYPVECP